MTHKGWYAIKKNPIQSNPIQSKQKELLDSISILQVALKLKEYFPTKLLLMLNT